MTKLLLIGFIYIILSELLAIICAFKIFFYDINTNPDKKYPYLYRDNMKINLIMFASCLWLPSIIIQKFREILK
jgi:hypothetical protein